jgi:hypothetical protein
MMMMMMRISSLSTWHNIHALLHGHFNRISSILRADEALISYIRMLPCGCCMLCYMLDSQICLHPPHTLQRKYGNRNVAHSHQVQYGHAVRSDRSLRGWVLAPAIFRHSATDVARPASTEPCHGRPRATARSPAGVLRRKWKMLMPRANCYCWKERSVTGSGLVWAR